MRNIIFLTFIFVGIFCSSAQVVSEPRLTVPENNITPNPQGDITDLTLVNRHPDCGAYVGSYSARIHDTQQNIIYDSYLTITADNNICTLISNNIPHHDVGANTTTGTDFSSQVAPNILEYVLMLPRNPIKGNRASYVRKQGGRITLNGIMLNGVDLDMDSAFCDNIEFTTPLQIGLGTRSQCGLFADGYAIPAANPDYVVLDEYTGHPFGGRYHYHSDNHGLSNVEEGDILEPNSNIVDASGSPVIGFAPDGFPIYGHYFYDTEAGVTRKSKSSWTTYITEREAPIGSNDPFPPISTHVRGIFVEDWHFDEGSVDLDECNGMTDAYGHYGYYYTEDYPYGPLCSFGTPEASFNMLNTAYDDGGVN